MINVLEYLEQTLERIADRNKIAFYGSVPGKSDEKANGPSASENDGLHPSSCLSFQKLSDCSRSCGSYLTFKGISKKPVAVFMQKSPAMIAAFFGVVYSGNYYIPLDAEMPAFRIRLILETVNPALIICDDTTAKLIAEWDLKQGDRSSACVIFDEIIKHHVNEAALADVRSKAIDTDPLYVVFTSGSTGIPKGVVATHRSVNDYIENLSAVLGVTENTVFGMQSPLYLDACLKEVYNTIKFGAATYLIPQSLFMFPVKLIEYINERGINTICWVASALSLIAGLGAFKSAVPDSLHTIAFGSEVFPIKHFNLWRELLPDARFIHLYGPTEATGMSCFCEITRTFDENESIPIGQPFSNTEIILIDDNGAAAKDGEPGEICIRGTCLSPGYFGDTEKTSKAFVQNPLSAFPDLIYKTGDLGRRGTGGELYYISRRDHQIKHMGYRIELAEIEYVANGCDYVGLACAVFDDEKSKIILYYVGKQEDNSPGTAITDDKSEKAAVKAYLKSNLPRYMMPQSIFELDELPQTPGGKIDRVGLLERYKAEK